MEKLKKWFNNYWYYYKWYTVVLFAVLLVVIICTLQCSTAVDYDLYMTYAGHQNIMHSLEPIREAVKDAVTGDKAEDIEYVAIRDMVYVNDEIAKEYLKNDLFFSPTQNADVVKTLQSELIAGDAYIYFIDRELFAIYEKSGVFAKLTDVLGALPESAEGEYGIRFAETEFYKSNSCFHSWGDDVILCLKAEQSDSAIGFFRGRNKQKQAYELHRDVFIDIMNYVPEAETASE